MKLEDVKKILHEDIKTEISGDDKTIKLIRVKDDRLVATIHFWKGTHPGLMELRCVLDGNARLDDIASTISCLFANLASYNKGLNGVIEGMVLK